MEVKRGQEARGSNRRKHKIKRLLLHFHRKFLVQRLCRSLGGGGRSLHIYTRKQNPGCVSFRDRGHLMFVPSDLFSFVVVGVFFFIVVSLLVVSDQKEHQQTGRDHKKLPDVKPESPESLHLTTHRFSSRLMFPRRSVT